MSEYQYYEFQAIDRPLSEADRRALRALSSRARITAASFTNHYEWGDFGGDPKALMARWFDLHLYLANWGTRRLMLRLPKPSVDTARLAAFLREVDEVDVIPSGDNVVIDICRDEVEPDYQDWDDGSGWLAILAPLRADAMAGDLRVFYLLWLMAVEGDRLPDGEPEPLPGIAPLTGPLSAFADFFGIDSDLMAAAAERSSGETGTRSDRLHKAVATVPEPEKTALLVRLLQGDPRVAADLRDRIAMAGPQGTGRRRTVGDLRARAAALRLARDRAEAERREARQRELAAQEERAYRARLAALKRRGEAVWREIEGEIDRRNTDAYDRAVQMLCDLKVIAGEQGTIADFAERVASVRRKHARKGKLLERIDRLMTQ